MRLLLLTSFCIVLSFFAKSQSDNDRWEVYLANYPEGAGSTTVNMSLRTNGPFQQHRFLLITGVGFKQCKEGLPIEGEFDNLYAISDSVKAVVQARVTNGIQAGSFTLQCERLDYIYLTDTAHLRQDLTELYTKRFPTYKPIVKIEEDKTWEAYHSFLYPSEEIMEYITNTKVVLKLEEAGDKLEKPRTVDHFLYFKTVQDRNNFVTYSQSKGYKVVEKRKLQEGNHPFQLHLIKSHKVDLETICKITMQMKKDATKYNGIYDGWESVVVK